MADLITDEMAETAHEAAMEVAALTPAGEFIDVGSVGAMIRAALSAVAPMIRAQAFREAGTVAFSLVEKSNYAAEKDDDQWQDGWIVGASDQAEGTRAALLALAQKETTR